MAVFSPERVTENCLSCHGEPDEAPAWLSAHYGSDGGFHYAPGDVLALRRVAAPLDEARGSPAAPSLRPA